VRNDETTTAETELNETNEAAETRDESGARIGNDWTPFEEIQDAIETLHALAWQRWHPRNPETSEVPVAKDVRDALVDLRPIADEARALWKHLARYAPNAPKRPPGRLEIETES
jgi:hypothetical protein